MLIWLDGGPSHFETFDPKPEAPEEIRGELGTVGTTLPGIRFGEYLPRLASMMNKLAVIRSVRHNQGNHGAGNHYMMTGAPPRIPVGCGAFVSFHPSMDPSFSSSSFRTCPGHAHRLAPASRVQTLRTGGHISSSLRQGVGRSSYSFRTVRDTLTGWHWPAGFKR